MGEPAEAVVASGLVLEEVLDEVARLGLALDLLRGQPFGGQQRLQRELDRVPEDVAPAQFLTAMIGHVLAVTPILHHVDVRSKYERRDIPMSEDDQQTDQLGPASGTGDGLFQDGQN